MRAAGQPALPVGQDGVGAGWEERGGLWAVGCSPPLQRGPWGPGDLGQDSVQVHGLGLLLHHILRHEVCRPREHSGWLT